MKIFDKDLIHLDQVAPLIPSRGGKHISMNTLVRWCRTGVRITGTRQYVKLDAVCMGKRWLTTVDAVDAFMQAVTAAEKGAHLDQPEKPDKRALADQQRVADKLRRGRRSPTTKTV